MRRRFLISLALALIPCGSHAAESLFAYAYTADPLPAGAREGYVRATHRWDKSVGNFRVTDPRVGIEIGRTDRFAYGFWLQGMIMRSDGAFPPAADGEEVYPFDIDVAQPLQSLGTELRYNFASPYTNTVGFTLVTELYHVRYYAKIDGSRTDQWSVEPHLIVQKNFLDDQLVVVYNAAVESEYRYFPDSGARETEFSISHNGGVTYRAAKGLYTGLEMRHHMDVVNGEKNHNDFFAGPTVLYSTQNWYVQATYLRQITGSPTYSGYDVLPDPQLYNLDTGLHLEEESKNEFRLKFGFRLGRRER